MAGLKVWLADRDGFYIGELEAPNARESFAEYAANAAQNGHTAIDQTASNAARPPDRPAVPDPDKVKRDRLQALRAKGFANLTAAERQEGQAIRFDLGLGS